MTDFTPSPLVLDTSILREVARGDSDIIALIQAYDARAQPLIAPALAMVGAALDVLTEEAADLLAGLDSLESVMAAPLHGVEQSVALAEVIAKTGLDAWDAHVAAIADVAVCQILTLDAARWAGPSHAMDNPLHVVEIRDPDEAH
ncbi:hypothetical protein ABGB17_12180 [Sphaerisporangium sp. B11E5]|uniref:hypothetical protein n=1 Tax=Sphaerisporangium sp. B11E5 TaxID=3153563 RepID=UPI00325D53E5